MSVHNKVICGDDLDRCKSILKKDISLLIDDINDLSSSILMNDRLHNIGWNDCFRGVLVGLNNCETAYKNLILNSAYYLNESCALTIPLYLLTLERILSSSITDERAKKLIQASSIPKRVRSFDIIKEWERSVHDETTLSNKEVFIDAVQTAGALGSVVIEQTMGCTTSELESGCQFKCNLHPFFYELFEKHVELTDCLLVVIDGAIIDVSEIHHLLTYAYENQTPTVIFASNYSDDVANTLIVNWEKGLVKVLPLLMDSGLDNINQVKDLCTVAGVTPISKESGVLISTLDFDNIPANTVKYSIKKQSCLIQTTTDNFNSIKYLREDVQKTLAKEKVEDVRNILKKRLARLSTRTVRARINCSKTEEGILRDRVISLIQLLARAGNEGVIDVQPVYTALNYTPSNFMPRMLPYQITLNAIQRAAADARAINNISVIIKLD
jgi:hypothetical protein